MFENILVKFLILECFTVIDKVSKFRPYCNLVSRLKIFLRGWVSYLELRENLGRWYPPLLYFIVIFWTKFFKIFFLRGYFRCPPTPSPPPFCVYLYALCDRVKLTITFHPTVNQQQSQIKGFPEAYADDPLSLEKTSLLLFSS